MLSFGGDDFHPDGDSMIHDFLDRSAATPEFKESVMEFLTSSMPTDRVSFDHRSPPVKVARVVTKLLESEGGLPIESLEIDGSSGCEFYRGEARVVLAGGEVRRIRFRWDCRWKAMEQGWTDYFGFPDQMRAAQVFGYDCFSSWEYVGAEEGAAA